MGDFVRARSAEQKEQRMEEIKQAADELFAERPYHEITLTTIADKLDWSRANLYKYVTTKEDILLEVTTDKRTALFNAMRAAFPAGCAYSLETVAEVWAGILNSHRDYLRYCDLVVTIIETNVTVERLAAFKKRYYEDEDEMVALLAQLLGISRDDAYSLFFDVHFHSVGLITGCEINPLVQEAWKLIGHTPHPRDFRTDMRRFIGMCLGYYCGRKGE